MLDPALRPTLTPAEMESGKTMAILSYALLLVGVPLCLLPLFTRENAFSLYHAKQATTLWLGALIAVVVLVLISPLMCLCPPAIPVLGPAIGVGFLVLTIFGLIAAVKPEVKPVPLLGSLAERVWRGLQMTPRAGN
jgi:uncharacterized membrane protein